MRVSIGHLRAEIDLDVPRPEQILAARARFSDGYIELHSTIRQVLRHLEATNAAQAEQLIAEIVDAEARTFGRVRSDRRWWDIDDIVRDWERFRTHAAAMTGLALAYLDEGDALVLKTFDS